MNLGQGAYLYFVPTWVESLPLQVHGRQQERRNESCCVLPKPSRSKTGRQSFVMLQISRKMERGSGILQDAINALPFLVSADAVKLSW